MGFTHQKLGASYVNPAKASDFTEPGYRDLEHTSYGKHSGAYWSRTLNLKDYAPC